MSGVQKSKNQFSFQVSIKGPIYNNDYEDDKKNLPLLMTMIPKINKGGCATVGTIEVLGKEWIECDKKLGIFILHDIH